jgi:hypothetical protein
MGAFPTRIREQCGRLRIVTHEQKQIQKTLNAENAEGSQSIAEEDFFVLSDLRESFAFSAFKLF